MRVLVFVGLAALAACATPCPPEATSPAPIVANYTCGTDDPLTVTYERQPDQALVAQPGYETVTLAQQVSGSGFRYAAGGIELRGQGREVRITRPGAGERICQLAN